jgi:hypothetical protein
MNTKARVQGIRRNPSVGRHAPKLGDTGKSRAGYLTSFDFKNLSISDFRNRSLRSNLKYGKACFFMRRCNVMGDIFKYRMTSCLVIRSSLSMLAIITDVRVLDNTRYYMISYGI